MIFTEASEYLKTEFYEKECGKNQGIVNCIGHTHIDVAWLWTVAQTREKAQRSFSTVINMMKYFDDYKFMSSQPQLYQHVKEKDPELYTEIKKRVAEGRWEVEGAMWLEADTNLISGESLIRQVLFGKRFMQKEFGADSKILWLPDVFGYSGALPQILKKSGVPKFFTTKMQWSETNKMPHDDFIWEGIDGTSVYSKFTSGYVKKLNPSDVFNTWKEYKDKNLTDNTMLTFGFGDGGGGPTYEMMENYARLKHGIPGMPAVKIQYGGDTFSKAEEQFRKSTEELKSTPKWKGEIYLEMHRGTYTSIAKNKKNNRKSELLHLNAENISVADMVLNGGEYPKETLDKNQTTILLNQFHDIIPGSSIGLVYDVTDVEYAQILKEGREIVEEKKQSIISSLKTDGGLFVYNPSPFEISDFIEVDGKTIYVENIPAHGWKVVEENYVDNGVTVCDKCIENDVVKVVFNDKYHIVSIYDKADRGINTFTYSLYPHTGDYRTGNTVQEGYALNIPLEVSKVNANNGNVSDNYSLVKSNRENVIVETIKKAEDDNSVIVRLYETYNQKSKTIITADFDFKEVYLCDMMENNIAKLENNGKDVEIKVKNFEIVTLKFTR